ncbi:MAG: hypothetical protein ACI9T9_000174 [Oleiphilaceae bacterium]|jgi:hypothetical protein
MKATYCHSAYVRGRNLCFIAKLGYKKIYSGRKAHRNDSFLRKQSRAKHFKEKLNKLKFEKIMRKYLWI